jgi:hypothetical protein
LFAPPAAPPPPPPNNQNNFLNQFKHRRCHQIAPPRGYAQGRSEKAKAGGV